MKRLKLARILEWGTIISACGLIFTVLLQIVSRKLLPSIAPPWTEEISRFFFIYTISFGAGLAQREGYFVSMDYFYRKFNARMRRILDLFISFISAVLFLVMAVYSVQYIVLGTTETSPSIGLPMSLAFASMFIMSGTVLYYLLRQLIHSIKSERK